MKRIFFTFLILVAFLAGYSQMTNNGGTITVENGATLVIEGDYTSTNSGSIVIDGAVQLKGDFVNNGGSIDAASAGSITFNGTAPQEITGNTPTNFYCAVTVNNTNGVALTNTQTGASQTMSNTFTLSGGKVTLNNFDLTVGSTGVTGADASKYIVTNGTGQLKASVANTNFLMPVGSATYYNPVILNEAGTSDVYGVRFSEGKPGGWTGTDHAVDGYWTVTEGLAGGANLSVTPQWAGAQEDANFDNQDCAVGVSSDLGGNVTWAALGAASGTDPYYITGSGFTGVGTFLVGDSFWNTILLNIDMFLAGPYNAGAMSTALNSQIPLTDPYGNGTNATSVPVNAVDWVEIELRSQANPATVVASYSGFLKNDGDVLAIDGSSGVKLTGLAKAQYYVAVRHRNHLGAMTASPIDFTAAGPYSFDFSTGSNIYGTNALQNMGTKWALWAGNANGDNKVIYQGNDNDPTAIGFVVSNDPGNVNDEFTYDQVYGYYDEDVNLDGYVIYQGNNNDPTAVGFSVSNHPGNVDDEFTFDEVVEQIPVP
ncbi:MAG TPA: hypothetical protein PLW31_00645 [Bacteroidales bacterium]|mgnify:CR=1 FL=1|nr:hypothetical protein [Bacteroidales bacterium]